MDFSRKKKIHNLTIQYRHQFLNIMISHIILEYSVYVSFFLNEFKFRNNKMYILAEMGDSHTAPPIQLKGSELVT